MNLHLFGATSDHLVSYENEGKQFLLHRHVVGDFDRLVTAAAKDGFRVAIASAFRDFDRQRAIWDAKASGQRPAYDDNGVALDLSALGDDEKLVKIFRWSALPGLSRHHWGTDIDIYDAAAVASDYELQLMPEEYLPGGPFAQLKQWLDQNADRYGFFFPYRKDLGGVHPEPWHMSHREVSACCLHQMDSVAVKEFIGQQNFHLKDSALKMVDQILDRFVRSVSQ